MYWHDIPEITDRVKALAKDGYSTRVVARIVRHEFSEALGRAGITLTNNHIGGWANRQQPKVVFAASRGGPRSPRNVADNSNISAPPFVRNKRNQCRQKRRPR